MTSKLNPSHACYVGSFDPPTLGHEDIIRRGAAIFERVTVGVGVNPDKRALFAPQERLALLGGILAPLPNVDVLTFEGLAVNFVRNCGAAVLLRGVRTLTDIEAEFTMSLANHALAPEIESVFLMSREKYTHISSTLIKQIARMGGPDTMAQLRAFVPQAVIGPLLEKYRPA